MELGRILQVEKSHIITPVTKVPATTEADREGQSFVLVRPPADWMRPTHIMEGGQSALLMVQ